MMPPTYQLLMPGALAGSAGLIASRNPKRYPALLGWAILTAFFVGVVWGGAAYPNWIIVASAALLPFQIRESMVARRIPVSWGRFAGFVVVAVAMATTIAMMSAPAHLWTVGRSYYQMAGMGVMVWASVHRARRPILESRRDVAYGVGMTIWLCIKAPASTFVRGGAGAVLFPWIGRDAVEQACYWMLMTCMVGMALAMWRKAPGRKRAAKTPKGLTRTGLIETREAA